MKRPDLIERDEQPGKYRLTQRSQTLLRNAELLTAIDTMEELRFKNAEGDAYEKCL